MRPVGDFRVSGVLSSPFSFTLVPQVSKSPFRLVNHVYWRTFMISTIVSTSGPWILKDSMGTVLSSGTL